ncbi:MAG: Gfo/Idh/MocA family protein [Aeromonadaceae bacterium]
MSGHGPDEAGMMQEGHKGESEMRAAIIGCNWGQIYIQGLRHHGVEVVALCGLPKERAEALARQHKIPVATDSVARLLAPDLALDLVVLATPAVTHAALLRQLSGLPVICEKPLFGLEARSLGGAGLGEQVWVNYAFAFLDSAQQIAALKPRLGAIERLQLACEYDLPLNFSPAQWWLEVASHPLSFLVHLFGEPRWVEGESWRHDNTLDCRIGGIAAQLSCSPRPGLKGISQQLRIKGEQGEIVLEGRFSQGEPWRYQPLLWNGQACNQGEWCPEDCWVRANVRSMGQILRQLRGELTVREALSLGLFNPAKAAPLDELIRHAWK